MGIATVLVHPWASVLSAWGQTLARREESAVRSLWLPLNNGWSSLEAAWEELEAGLTPEAVTTHARVYRVALGIPEAAKQRHHVRSISTRTTRKTFTDCSY